MVVSVLLPYGFKVAKLNGQQWDTLVDKMHQSNRVKQR
jgi:hypothetical protein